MAPSPPHAEEHPKGASRSTAAAPPPQEVDVARPTVLEPMTCHPCIRTGVTHLSGLDTRPWHPRVGGEGIHAEARSTRRIALFSATSAAPRAKLVDARPKAWHDGVGQR